MSEIFRCSQCSFLFPVEGKQSVHYWCLHPSRSRMQANLDKMKSNRMAGFISHGKPDEPIPLKTSPRWCPLKDTEAD